ncbi:GlsB/YeaQ/YmgE family stress response membrane protein [Bacillus piscicola]|uniref:GlsB/YeaQ/YmgE family stress response membrane protein n=1 Tax=Bacillus piscicola TaxID=1632684 RepID=UPI001F098BD8|nr:GlsB/YeaQ/YmgE family stress response membrane protein [Bacillus piscicola]
MGLILFLIIGGIIGWIAGIILGKDLPGGVIGNIVAGVVGSWIGSSLFGSWGPDLAGIAIFPALLGAIIFIFILTLILRAVK